MDDGPGRRWPRKDGAILAKGLGEVHRRLGRVKGFAPLRRIAVVGYDADQDLLFALAHSGEAAGLDLYECRLSDVPSLALVASGETPRVIDDLSVFGGSGSHHTRALLAAGLVSSLTVPVFAEGVLAAFVFLNADVPGFFTPAVVAALKPVCAAIVGSAMEVLAAPAGGR